MPFSTFTTFFILFYFTTFKIKNTILEGDFFNLKFVVILKRNKE